MHNDDDRGLGNPFRRMWCNFDGVHCRLPRRICVQRFMSDADRIPSSLKCWLTLSRLLQPLIHLGARRLHNRQGLDSERFSERLGRATAARGEGQLIWIHAASLGEISQAAGLLDALEKTRGVRLIVTTMTLAGADWAAKNLPAVPHQYLPLDTPRAVGGFLDHWSPDLAMFIEADIWPRLVMESAARKIPLVLINARPSKSRDRAPKFYGYLLSQFCAITCKSAQVLEGLRALGLAREKLHYFGDLRASVPALRVDALAATTLSRAIADRPVWIAASSHAADEAQILSACKTVGEQHPEALLIWAPRHPKRAPDILEAASDLVVHSRSKLEPITPRTQIYLADTFGELGTLFSCSKIVFLGGSFGSEGGHNPYEPANFGCYMITGPHVRNHRDAFEAFIRAGAAETVPDAPHLAQRVSQLIEARDADARGANAHALVAAGNEAAPKTLALLLATLRADHADHN
jgi:3-deoxy-D-manno-octulosonic-acid transferase